MQYRQRKLHLSVTETRRLLISRPHASRSGSISEGTPAAAYPAATGEGVGWRGRLPMKSRYQ